MGAWGVGTFENDDAQDWLADFSDAPSLAAVRDALSVVAEWDENEYLEIGEAAAALCAAEVVAALAGAPNPELPDKIARWCARKGMEASQTLVPLALRAVARVRSNSEMSDDWIDEATRQSWQRAVAELEAKVSGFNGKRSLSRP